MTNDQANVVQIDELRAGGCDRIYHEHGTEDRPPAQS